MRNKLIVILIFVCSLSTFLFVKVAKDNKKLKEEIVIKESNFNQLFTENEVVKNENGTYLIKLKEFEFTREELEKSNKNLTNKLVSLGIRVKDLQSIVTTETESNLDINTILRDTIAKIKVKYVDSLGKLAEKYELKKIKDFYYFDPFYRVKGFVYDSAISLKINHIDSIFIINYRYKKCKTPIIKWFRKWNYRTDVTNSDTTTKLITPTKIEMRNE